MKPQRRLLLYFTFTKPQWGRSHRSHSKNLLVKLCEEQGAAHVHAVRWLPFAEEPQPRVLMPMPGIGNYSPPFRGGCFARALLGRECSESWS